MKSIQGTGVEKICQKKAMKIVQVKITGWIERPKTSNKQDEK